MNGFELLKRTYPVSKHRRYCDGYLFILNNTTKEERTDFGINDKDLQLFIEEGEKYIYQVAKDGDEFKTMCLCFKNHSIIRKHLKDLNEDF